MQRDLVIKLVFSSVIAASPSLVHAQGESNPVTHFSLDLIEIRVEDESPRIFPSDLEVSFSQIMELAGGQSAAQSGETIFPALEIHILVSDQSNPFNTIDPLLDGGFDNRSGTQNMNNTRFSPKPDSVNVVPLPPAALAGMGMLAGIAGVRYMRIRKITP